MQYPRLARDPDAVCRRHHRTIRKLLERRPAFSARSPIILILHYRLRFGDTISRMLDWSQCAEVERPADRVSGSWVFRGTRVPVSALFENLEDGARFVDFLAWFPGVGAKQVEAVLEYANRSLTEAPRR